MGKLAYIKGHCGWDTVSFVDARDIPEDQLANIGNMILNEPIRGGIEVCFMWPGKNGGDVAVKIFDCSHRDWIPMCGGMSQIMGKVLTESSFAHRFNIPDNSSRIIMETDSGLIPIDIHNNEICTQMKNFCEYVYKESVYPIEIFNIQCMRVGNFLIINIDELNKAHPDIDFTRRDPGEHVNILHAMHLEYQKQASLGAAVYSILYDLNPEGPGYGRLFTRFLDPSHLTTDLPYELQCGTGTIAAGIAMAERGELPFKEGEGSLLLEWGSQKTTPDPYGIRCSELHLELSNGKVIDAAFSHSVIEILIDGELTLPKY
ncbi:MAG: hypothetical protein HRU15_06780 [Planctomycetes bacterium]|nr:hypothetical protein [Planctomycetota bacterium]